MIPSFRRLASIASLAAALAGCSDSAPIASAVSAPARAATDLQLVIPASGVLTSRRLDGGSTVTLLDSQPASSRVTRSLGSGFDSVATFSSAFTDAAIIQYPTSRAYFMSANGSMIAIGEGSMRFLANRAEQAVSVSVSTPTGSLLNATQFDAFAASLPAWYDMVTYARVPIAGDCGYSALASTTHKAWHQFPLPPFTEFGHAFASSMSGADQLPACPTQIKTTTGTGGEGDSRITDSQWQICYWLVWYDSNGVELWRDFLYCTTM